jgi:ABC-type nitrate/sulfonate/bicarbonate transport system substrate-binding protein
LTTRRALFGMLCRGVGISLAGASCRRSPSNDAVVTLALPTTTLALATLYVAEEWRLFEQERLALVTRTVTGVGSVNAVLAGSADFTIGSATTMLRGVARGQRFVAIANLIDRPLIELVIRHEVAKAQDVSAKKPFALRARALKGLTIAVQGVASFSETWARYVASAAGLSADRDVRLVPMDPPAMVGAYRAKQIDGYVASPPYSTQTVLSSDAVVLASGATDVPDLLPFGYGLLYCRPETIAQRPDACRRIARAFALAARGIHERPDDVFEQVVRRRFAEMAPDLLVAAWKEWREALARDVRITESHLHHAQQVSIRAGLVAPQDAVTDYSSLFTDRFI